MTRASAFFLGFLSLAVIGRADTISTVTLSTNDCSGGGGCLVGSNDPTVTLDDEGNGTVIVTENLPSYMVYAGSGAGQSLAFDLLSTATAGLSVTNVTTGFTFESGTFHDDGTGDYDYAVDCGSNCTGGQTSNLAGPLSFTITSTSGISAADFIVNGDGNLFTSDVASTLTGGTGNTGDVTGGPEVCVSGPGCGGTPQSVTPEPVTLWLTGAGLVALGLVRKRRMI